MKEYHEVGDHYLYICDMEQVYEDEANEFAPSERAREPEQSREA